MNYDIREEKVWTLKLGFDQLATDLGDSSKYSLDNWIGTAFIILLASATHADRRCWRTLSYSPRLVRPSLSLLVLLDR